MGGLIEVQQQRLEVEAVERNYSFLSSEVFVEMVWMVHILVYVPVYRAKV